jgi:FkbM family methyltransferase
LLSRIDFDFITSIVENVVEENQQENMQEIAKQTLQLSPTQAAYDMLDFSYNKMVALNFLRYCLENKKTLCFDLNLFETGEDREEIHRYIRNIIYVALSQHNPVPSRDFAEQQEKYNAFLRNIQKSGDNYSLKTSECEYILPINHFEKVVFYHNYGIPNLPPQVKAALAGTDFIDAGAYIGDTALILNQYQPRRIYAFEPAPENYELMQKTLRLNKVDKVTPVASALGNCESTLKLFRWDNASFLSESGTQQVNVTSIDAFQAKNSLNVGLVKMDIEGAEYNAVLGAKQTIETQKPTLAISLYHTGRDFFEIPKLLKQWVPSYRFRFLNLHRLAPILEKVLLAYCPT